VLGNARFKHGLNELVAGMLGAGSPQMTKAAGSAPQPVKAPFSLAKRFYRLMGRENYTHEDWLKALQTDARRVVNKPSLSRSLWRWIWSTLNNRMPSKSRALAAFIRQPHLVQTGKPDSLQAFQAWCAKS
jgi:hypothetical protein